jgi:sphingomyelin phosphodiesterase acid-like 3
VTSLVMRCAMLLALGALGVAVTSTASSSVDFAALAEYEAITDSNDNDTGNNTAATTDTAKVRHILHFSDVHLNISKSLNASDSAKIPVAYGDDAPTSLLVSALDYAKQLLPDPDFFLYTGDHAVHGDLTDEYLAEAVDENVKLMAQYYSTATNNTVLDITAIIGNADTSACSSLLWVLSKW